MKFLVWPRAHGEEIENIALATEERRDHVETVREGRRTVWSSVSLTEFKCFRVPVAFPG